MENLVAAETSTKIEKNNTSQMRNQALRWALTVLSGLAVYLAPLPEGITQQSWQLLAIFVATITGSILRPAPGGAIVLLGIATIALTRSMPLSAEVVKTVTDPRALEILRLEATLAGYAEPVVWLVLAAFFISRGMIKTGLGRRIALIFIRALGHRSLGLAYALVGTDAVLATVIPSNAARMGGILFPVARSIAEAYDSKPGPTAARLGAFLMGFLYQCEVIICGMFLTGQASNVLIQRFARQVSGIDLNYTRWMIAAIVPGIISLAIVSLFLYRIFPPEIKETPGAAKFARAELEKMGMMSRQEKIMLLVFFFVAAMWMTYGFHRIEYTVIALTGICVLLISGVIEWEDLMTERSAWDVFIWYGGLVRMAEALGEAGITRRFAEMVSVMTSGWRWWIALGLLAIVYYYAHYVFASITAHVIAMYTPFLIVAIATGSPPFLAVALLAFFSNMSAGLTHYGTTPGPIYFGAGYLSQQKWWQLGLIASIPNIVIWITVGLVWWKILGWW
jgi:divalent anion:Na+ symporter, DASS family